MKISVAEFQQIFLQDVYYGTTDTLLNSDKERLDIYVNNTQLTLIDLLRAVYPVVEQVVGTDFFNTIAKKYIQKYPSISGNRYEFGKQLTIFLKDYVPDQLPYLSDLAHLEWAHHFAYSADDNSIMTFERLQQLANDEKDFGLTLHPSVQIILTQYNVLDIWQAHQLELIPTIYLQKQLYPILIFRDIQNTIHMKTITTELHDFLSNAQQSFQNALHSVEMETFQMQFAECMVQGIFADQKENI